MNRKFAPIILGAVLLATPLWATLPPLADSSEMSKETRSTVFYMELEHYLSKPLAEFDQRELLKTYMSNLDMKHLFLLQGDVSAFQDQYADVVVKDVRELGSLDPAYAIFKKFDQSVHDRVTWINKYLDGDLNLEAKDSFRPDRTDAAWPASPDEADKLWEQQIRFEVINEMVSAETRDIEAAEKKTADAAAPAKPADAKPADKTAEAAKPKAPLTQAEKIAAAKDIVRKRYNSSVKTLDETDSVEVQDVFLNTLAGQYDPHSNFFTDNGVEEFDITMRNSLIGIGCILQDKDGYCVVSDLVPGGPAQKSDLVHPGDKIIAVGQTETDFTDVVGAKLRKTVSLIRGAEGSLVHLKIIPAGMTSEGDAKVITLKREQIKLTSTLAKAQIIDVPAGDQTLPIGVINLPAFYGKGGDGDKFSTTDDVRELLLKLKAAGVKGVVLDLRNNGGGFLNEAIDMTGLFIPPSPVLQVRNALGFIKQMKNDSSTPVWDGPLMLLVSKQSASATEILTGALQDYHRALVVGDHTTHGKGTVQQMYYFNTFDPTEKGAAKVTIEKWYRPDGNSIQSRGVTADIALPSVIDFLPIGEGDLKNALPWDSVKSVPLELKGDGPWRASLVTDTLVNKLRQESDARQNSLPEFSLFKQLVDWKKAHQDEKDFSLNFDERMKEQRTDISFSDDLKKRLTEMAKGNYKATDILLDAAKDQAAETKTASTKASAPASSDTTTAADDPDAAADPAIDFDIQLREGLRIMGDWLRIGGQDKAGTVARTTTGNTPSSASSSATSSSATPLPSVPADPIR